MASQSVDYFPPTAEQKESELKAFKDSIEPSDVCNLASQYNHLKPCQIFHTDHGSYNVCFFVEFEDGVKWVVRIPSVSSVYNIWDKVQSEVATIRYLEANTTIPVPHIHAFGRGGVVNKNNPTGHTFIIQEYIPGRSLDIVAFIKESKERRKHFYVQLVDILDQLRQQEFDEAGSLMPDPNGGNTPLVGPMLSIQLNNLQLESRNSAPPPAKFDSASGFASYHYGLLAQAYTLPTVKLSQEMAQLEVFGLEDLKGTLSAYIGKAKDRRKPKDRDRFVLTHTDLRWSNIIVDEDYRIQGVIDWEWSATVPRQFFLSPTWLAALPPDEVFGVHYTIEYSLFFDVLKDVQKRARREALKDPESKAYSYSKLASEWSRTLPTRLDLPMAVILRHHSCFVNMYYRAIFPEFHDCPRDEVIKNFFERDGKHGRFTQDTQRKLKDSERYTQYLIEQTERIGKSSSESTNGSIKGLVFAVLERFFNTSFRLVGKMVGVDLWGFPRQHHSPNP